MRITSVETFPIRMKPVKPGFRDHQSSHLPSGGTVIVRINTDAGIHGLGEAATEPAYYNQTLRAVLDWLKAYGMALEGSNPLDIINAHNIMNAISGESPPGCHPARAGIDLALHDLIGKAHDCPVYEVLGGAHRTEFPMLTNLYELTPQEKAAAAVEFVKKGFSGLKIKVGHRTSNEGINTETLNWEKEKLIAALDAVPEEVAIDADPNQSWGNSKITVKIIEEILREKFRSNLSIEQPLHHLDLEGHRYIRQALKIPVILDESVVSPQAVLQIVRQNAADRIVLKFSRVGGLWPAMKIVAICEATWIGISVDTMPFTKLGDTANCHLAAAIRDTYPIDVEGHLWFEDTPIRGGLEIRDGRATIGSQPGFGVEIDEKKLAAMAIPPSELAATP
ncbi:MAG: mandelate racemase/muconate lactonizing enzyme family protein [Hyphomicrobiales bacterium]|nr:mandelate racemase/muconate lactonizing enzyme family protein [Hyphomicrobiales bacterium]